MSHVKNLQTNRKQQKNKFANNVFKYVLFGITLFVVFLIIASFATIILGGFESVNKNQYEDFASKGATLQGYERFNDAMGGGYNLDLPRLTSGPNSGQVDRNSPEFLYYYGDSQQKPNIGAGILGNMFMGNATPPSTPVSEQTPIPGIIGNLRPKSDDPLVQGYMDSDFYESKTTANVVPYTYQGKEMSVSGSYASNFKKYLDSIGKGDLIQFPDQGIAQQGSGPLATIGGPTPPPGFGTPMDPIGVGQDVTGNNPKKVV